MTCSYQFLPKSQILDILFKFNDYNSFICSLLRQRCWECSKKCIDKNSYEGIDITLGWLVIRPESFVWIDRSTNFHRTDMKNTTWKIWDALRELGSRSSKGKDWQRSRKRAYIDIDREGRCCTYHWGVWNNTVVKIKSSHNGASEFRQVNLGTSPSLLSAQRRGGSLDRRGSVVLEEKWVLLD